MKIHYISCHAILEWDEVSLLTEMGHDVFSNGAYIDPKGHIGLPRPEIPGAVYYPELAELARNSSKANLPDELIEPFDLIVIMHMPEVLRANWNRIKHKKVIFRSIGQSLPWIEAMLAEFRKEGLRIVRYSPKEANIKYYAGEDTIIRFYKDPAEYGGWRGTDVSVLNASQALKGRRNFCGYDIFMEATKGLPRFVLGSGNEDLGNISLGEVSYDKFKDRLRDHRVFFYAGTWPASYTLSFIEAMMTGIPIVAVGRGQFYKHHTVEHVDTYEVPDLIANTIDGFVSDDPRILKGRIQELFHDYELARSMGERAREKAISLFGKSTIKDQWETFLTNIW